MVATDNPTLPPQRAGAPLPGAIGAGAAGRWRHRPGSDGLRLRLLVSYLAVTVLVLTTVDILTLTWLERSGLAQRRDTLVDHARVVAGVSALYMLKGHDYLEYIARDYGQQVGARVLIIGRSGEVLQDSFYDPALQAADLSARSEVAAALGGRTAARLDTVAGAGRTLYAAVPVLDRGQVVGAVLLAQVAEPLWAELAAVRGALLLVSAAALAVAALVGWAMATSLSRPVRQITAGVQAVAAGDLSARVPVAGRDELAGLAAAFNAMSARLARLEESRRTFVANAAHELRTPLAAVKALAEPLASGAVSDPAEQGEFLQEICREVDRLAELAADLLTLSELEAGRPLRPAPLAAVGLLDAVLSRLRPLARARDVTLALDVPPDLTLTADGLRLERAVYNLVHNAITYSHPGGSVSVSARAAGGETAIAVADQGPGIPAAELPHLFERFHRVEPSRSRDRGGSGLGLAIAREIAQAHGGRIRVESRVGEGTRFVLELPA